MHYSSTLQVLAIFYNHGLDHGLRTPREEMAFTAQPKIHSHSQIFRYGRSIFCLPHRPIFSDIFDLCLHWVSVVRDSNRIYIFNFSAHVKKSLLMKFSFIIFVPLFLTQKWMHEWIDKFLRKDFNSLCRASLRLELNQSWKLISAMKKKMK